MGFREVPKPWEQLLEAPSSQNRLKKGNFGGGDQNIPLGMALIPYWDAGTGKQGMFAPKYQRLDKSELGKR